MTWRPVDTSPPLSGTLILLKHPKASRPEDVRLVGDGGIEMPYLTVEGKPILAHLRYDEWTWRPLMPSMEELYVWWEAEFPKLVENRDLYPAIGVWSLFSMMETAGIGLSRVQVSATLKTHKVWLQQDSRTPHERDHGVMIASWQVGEGRGKDSRYRRAVAVPDLTP